MAERVRRYDWSSTPLGPIYGWPQSLRTTVSLLIAAPVPMVLLWGKHGVMIYNDAYSVFAGGHHPRLLGSNVREGWPEVAAFNDNVMKVGLAGGTLAYKDQELTLHRHGKPEQVWMDLDYWPVPDESGCPGGVIATVVETTARVESDRARTATNERLNLALSAGLGVGTWDFDIASDRVVADRRFAEIYGVDPVIAIQGAPLSAFFQAMHPADAERVAREVQTTLDTHAPFRSEYRLIQSDGQVRWVLAEGRIVTDADGRLRFPGVTFDITERRAADAVLAETESRYDALFNSTSTGFCIIQMKFDADMRPIDYMIVEGNPAFEEMTGLHGADGKWVSEVAPGLEQHWFDLYGGVVLTGETVRFEQPADIFGRWYDVEALRIGDPEIHRVAILFTNITERRQAAARQQALLDLNDAIRDLTDPDEIAHASSKILAETLGVSRVGYGVMDTIAETVTIARDYNATGIASIAGVIHFRDFGSYIEDLTRGETVIMADAARDLRVTDGGAALASIRATSLINMPLMERGKVVALLFVNNATPRAWCEDDVALVREVAERVRTASERARAAADLEDSEARYRTLFDTMDEGFCVVEFLDGPSGPLDDYIHVEANPAAAEQVGMASVVGRRIRELAPKEAQEWIDLYGNVLQTGQPVRFEKAFGSTGRWLELSAFRVEPPSRRQVAVLFKDLTERNRTERALRDSEAQFRAFAEAVPNHVWASRPNGELYWFNSQVYAYTGVSEGELDGPEGWGKIVHPDDLPGAAAVWAMALETREVYRTEFRIRRADGAWRWFSVGAEPVHDQEGRLTGWVGANSDIDDIRRQGEQLETLNAQLEVLLEGSNAERDRLWLLSQDMLARADYGGGLSAVNPAWTRVLGWSEHELLTNPYADIIDPENLPATAAALEEMQRTGLPTRFENRILTKDKVWTPIGWTVAPEPDGLNFIAVGRDLSEDKGREVQLAQAQEALRQSQKMEAVGQLTGGIAHDFNNLLAGISGSLELLSKRLSEGRLNGMDRYIDAAQGSAHRAASLTQRLLAFSRRQTLDPKPTDTNRLIGGMEDLIRRTVGPDIEVEVVGAGGLWATKIDKSQLENALLNLCINARDAMAPAGGRLTIETSNKWLDDRSSKSHDLPPGQYVSLCVTDTGTGMPPEVQAQAFDPFFTTKPMGQGTGLGLSMIHGFVRQSGGQVRIYSEMGKGTTMCLYLPRYLGGVDGNEDTSITPVAEGGHGETVLIIDDEETVRMLIAEVLGDAGYNVIEAPDGPSGLDILRSDRRIDLLVSDVGLPGGMNGRQVADAARVSRPDLKVLFITGYAENAAVGNGLLAPGMEVLTKPFVMGDLAAKVHDLIES
ncbi:PAS domain S-box protein [Brevundimonas sp.]|uniref:PAS domain S-box protein n=1 Tax=Brevundimonas sp. TaxID=1871086 RepID=UPI002AB8480D|nr:PAS domain S-box protein [Brevundimonas sp.]MDZ4361797.1 PAS domain S-box protein [Brevundimonas sp.]